MNKKLVLLFAVLAVVLPMARTNAADLSSGHLIKAQDGSQLYVLLSDKRYVLPSALGTQEEVDYASAIMSSYGWSTSSTEVLPLSQVESYQIVGNATIKPQSFYLLQHAAEPSVYYWVDYDNHLLAATNVSVDYHKVTVPETYFANYTTAGVQISTVSVTHQFSDAAVVEWQTDIPQQMRIKYSPYSPTELLTVNLENQSATNHKALVYGGFGNWVAGNKLYYQLEDQTYKTGQIYESVIGGESLGVSSGLAKNITVDNVGAKSFRLNWTTALPTTAVVEYSLANSGDNISINENNNTTNHQIEINNLASGKDYIVRINSKLTGFTSDLPLAWSAIKNVTTLNEVSPNSTTTATSTATTTTTTTAVNIRVNENSIRSSGIAPIDWNTNIRANCWVEYSAATDLSGSFTLTGNIVQIGLPTNDGRFYYTVQLSNININNNTYYRVNCTSEGDSTTYRSVIKTLPKYQTETLDRVKALAPLGGETFKLNDGMKIRWAGGRTIVQIGLVKGEVPAQNGGLVGWIKLDGTPNGEFYWDVKKSCSLDNTVCIPVLPGMYKLMFVSKTVNGNLIFGNDGPNGELANWALSNAFYLKSAQGEEVKPVQPINEYDNQAKSLKDGRIQELLSQIKQLRDELREQAADMKYLKAFAVQMRALNANMQTAIKAFIAYGVDDNTKKLGEGERAAVVSSYKAAFDKLPQTEAELADAIKIANGRFPSIISDKAEQMAKEQFYKIYKRVADMNDAKDAAAIKVMAYGLRQKATNRNMKSEAAGIKTFKNIFGATPKKTEDWNTMQAITYSGASRKADSDKDGVADETEKKLGTDPKKADTDGDGYKDGDEVLKGYNPKGK